ncbi:MAG: cytochrome c3 family protein [Bacteroidales bacterium]|nr:cytochrome c3 family protein [Bacteroidales bacterium]
MKKLTIILFSIIFSFSLSGQTENLSCTDCHDTYIQHEVMHAVAADDCETCHMSTGSEHPQDGVKGFDLGDEMPALCFMCHEEHTKENVHAVSTECLMCHSPHGSANKSLLLSSPQSILCAECHDMSLVEKRVKHEPLADGNCTSCHHPHQSDYSQLLKAEKPQLCFNCHVSVQMETGLENIHPPLDDECANCHNVHSTVDDKLLIQKMPDLCYNCHDMQTTIEEAPVDHKVVSDGKGCSNCHSPHASDQRSFLLDTEKELCLSCHSKTIETEDKTLSNIGQTLKKGNYIHGVIEGDGCIVCHNPHSSDKSLLLNGAFPSEEYVAATAENFDICFMCHDSQLMTVEFSEYTTNFRNGDQNMHYLHINGNKGRNCNLCHNVHGSAYEHLIADKVMFGKWEMPMEYKLLENGGSCKTGCHAEKKYIR